MAQRRLIISTEAATDLAEAQSWLLQVGSGKLARRRYHAVLNAIRNLPLHATWYRRLPDQPLRRLMVVSGYRVIYSISADDEDTGGDVTVLAVFGPGEP